MNGMNTKYNILTVPGFLLNARKSSAYIIYMNGMVGKVSQEAKNLPGYEIVVPGKICRKMSIAETMSHDTGMASAAMIATIANVAK